MVIVDIENFAFLLTKNHIIFIENILNISQREEASSRNLDLYVRFFI